MRRNACSDLALATAWIVLALAVPASAQIVVGHSIDGVALGDTEAEVLSKLGPPQIEKTALGLGGPESSKLLTGNIFAQLRGSVYFDAAGQVDSMSTGSAGQLTSKGIHTNDGTTYGIHGSSLRALRKAYPSIKCRGDRTAPVCALTSRVGDRTVYTAFVFFGLGLGVSEIEIAYHLRVHY